MRLQLLVCRSWTELMHPADEVILLALYPVFLAGQRRELDAVSARG